MPLLLSKDAKSGPLKSFAPRAQNDNSYTSPFVKDIPQKPSLTTPARLPPRLATCTRKERRFFELSGREESMVMATAAAPLLCVLQCWGLSESSKLRLRTISAYSPPSAEQLMSSKKMPYRVGLMAWPG